MQSKLKDFTRIDKETRFCVAGWIRQHKELIQTSSFALFHRIPSMVISISTLYYHFRDYFDSRPASIYGTNGRPGTPQRTIHASCWSDGNNTTYGSMLIPSESSRIYNYKWYFETKLNKKFAIGIATAPFETASKVWLIRNNKHYIWTPKVSKIKNNPHKQRIYADTKSHKEGGYTRKSKNNIICALKDLDEYLQYEFCMELDLKRKSLILHYKEYSIILFDDIETGKDINYRLATSLLSKNHRMKMTSYKEEYLC